MATRPEISGDQHPRSLASYTGAVVGAAAESKFGVTVVVVIAAIAIRLQMAAEVS